MDAVPSKDSPGLRTGPTVPTWLAERESAKSASTSPPFVSSTTTNTMSIEGAPPSPTSSSVTLPSPKESNDLEEFYGALEEEAFVEAHIAQLAKQVSAVIVDIVQTNDKSPFTTDKLTRFHSRAAPGISVQDYLLRIIKFCNLDKAVLLVLLYFADLFSESYSRFVLSSLTVHRFIITAVAVASKGLCDLFCTNTHYAKVGGITVMELNLLEVEFLTRVSYKIVPPQHVLPKYYHLIKLKGDSSVVSDASSASSVSNMETSSGTTADLAPTTSGEANAGASRKHSREGLHKSLSGESISGRGLKAVKEGFKFFHSNKKKRAHSGNAP